MGRNLLWTLIWSPQIQGQSLKGQLARHKNTAHKGRNKERLGGLLLAARQCLGIAKHRNVSLPSSYMGDEKLHLTYKETQACVCVCGRVCGSPCSPSCPELSYSHKDTDIMSSYTSFLVLCFFFLQCIPKFLKCTSLPLQSSEIKFPLSALTWHHHSDFIKCH